MLSSFFCEDVSLKAQYLEAKGQVCTAKSKGSQETFLEVCLKMKQYIQDVLLEVISSDDPIVSDFQPKTGILRQVIKPRL